MSSPGGRDRTLAAFEALLAQAESERDEVEMVLVDLAAALAEKDIDRLVRRLVDSARRVAAATFGLFVPRSGAGTGWVGGPGHVGFAEAPAVAHAPLLASAVLGEEALVIDDVTRWAPSDDAQQPYGTLADGRLVRSWLVLPVRADGGVNHGAVVLGYPDAGRFDDRRERLATALAQHLAGALDRAALHQERSRIAQVLQETLLPPLLPRLPGVELAARYRATGAGNLVGGDFYDVFDVGKGTWAIVLGDVSGFGPEAAAITGQARYTVRAVAHDESTPSGVLRRLNQAIGNRADDRFCTAVYLHLRPLGGTVEVVLSRGGHPPPMVLRNDGGVDVLDAGAGLPLGLFPDAAVEDVPCTLAAGDAIVLYTDGVIEARDASGSEFGDELLPEVLRSCAGRTADGIARRIELAAMDFQGGTAGDDVAIVVARAMSTP
jgi:serine phosphatase RsbU (regulator of sigma subunit)